MSIWLPYINRFRAYLNLEKGLSDNSVGSYLQDVSHLQRYAEGLELDPEAVSFEHLQHLLAQLSDLGIAATTQCRMISGWRTFYNMLVLDGDIQLNPAKELTMPIRPQHLPDVLTNDEIAAIQSTFDRSMPDQDRNYLIVEILYGCGLRVSELVNMTLSCIYDAEECLLITGKGDKQRWVPINSRALRLLLDYIAQTRSCVQPKPDNERYVFLNRYGTRLSRNYVFMFLQKAVQEAGIQKHVSPHSLRHSFATELVQNGADLRAVQEMLGHAKLTTTEIYTHLGAQYLRDTITNYHPHYRL
ncbi:MAG: tyrosine-type recombinase/integrase [Bacteroidales bacterium]|nr:tyrosine-type recombinase/integrase [Candidatus Colimorpha onthohippi]